jgi:hypothetical protein
MSLLTDTLQHLLSAGEPSPSPGKPTRHEVGTAFAHRVIALIAWLRGEACVVLHDMFLSGELFAAQGNVHEAAVSRALLGLFLSDHAPADALLCFDAALGEMREGFWLRPYALVVKAQCLLALGRREESRSCYQELCRIPTAALDDLRLGWLGWRLRGRLGEPYAAVVLSSSGRAFLDVGLYEEAILCAADLIELAVSPQGNEASCDFAEELVEACEERIALTGPFGTALSALRRLYRETAAGRPFSEAAQPLASLVPSVYRFHFERLASLVPGCISEEPDGNGKEPPLGHR